MVERERELIKKLQEKRVNDNSYFFIERTFASQEKEIEQILEYEKKLEEKRRKQEMKKQKQLEKEMAQKEEAERKRAEVQNALC